MSELGRLLDEGDDTERALLAAGKDATEDRERERRTLAALGLGGPPPDPTDGGAGAAASGGASTLASALKWGAFALVGGAMVVGGLSLGKTPVQPAIAPVPSAVSVVAPAPEPPTALADTAETARPGVSTEVSAPPAPKRAPAASASASRRPEPQTTELAREIAALDRVRNALSAGDTASAKRDLDRYDRDFPFGVLSPEARALRERLRKKDSAGSNR